MRQYLRGHLALARISNGPTVITNTWAGAALAGAFGSMNDVGVTLTVAAVSIAMLLFYIAGMYLNDVLDYAVDCRERPERPLPAGLVSLPVARGMVIVLFGIGSLLLWSAGLPALFSGLLLIVLIVVYDRWHKRNPLSPLLMGLCRGMVYITAFLAVTHSPFTQNTLPLLIATSLLVLYIVGLTAVAKTERRANVAGVVIVATLFLPMFSGTLHFTLLFIPLLLLFITWVVYSLSFIYRDPRGGQPQGIVPTRVDGRQVGRAVGQLIAGIALVDGLVLAAMGGYIEIIAALGAWGLTLFLQRYVKGT
jgi:4-hydroxybenzoate polyprenyltransferase